AKTALSDLIAATEDKDLAVRIRAVNAIGQMGEKSPAVMTSLLKAVGDQDPMVRIAAVNSIRQLETDPKVIVPLVVKILGDKEQPLYASRMLETLVDQGEKAIPFLVAALDNEEAAYWACLAIEELEATAAETAPKLVELLSGDIPEPLRIQALLAVAKLGDAGTVSEQAVLESMGKSFSPSVQTAAAYASGALGFSKATEQLESTKASEEPLLKLVSLWSLAKLAPENASKQRVAVDHLIAQLRNSDPNIRLAAAKGLESLEYDRDAVRLKLTELVKEADPLVRYNLIDTFASLGERSAEPAGRALENEELRDIAIEVLIRIGPDAKAALPKLLEVLPASTGAFRRQIQVVLGQLGADSASATPELIKSLGQDRETVIGALTTLGLIGSGASAAAPKVMEKMKELDDPGLQVLAAWCVAQTASSDELMKPALAALVKGLEIDDRQLRVEVVNAIAALGAKATTVKPALVSFAKSIQADQELHQLVLGAIDSIE
ncbi:MAG: HEAT repeat domain-containing protein, partial [Planctomycetota bacterium]